MGTTFAMILIFSCYLIIAFLSVCPNGEYQENASEDICSTWFDINKCDDYTCDTWTSDFTGERHQTRCNLNPTAVGVLTPMGLGTSGAICDEDGPGGPYRLHQTNNYLQTWRACSWCCNWCHSAASIGNSIWSNQHIQHCIYWNISIWKCLSKIEMFLECEEDAECKEKDSYNPYCYEGQCNGNTNA